MEKQLLLALLAGIKTNGVLGIHVTMHLIKG